MRGPIRPIIMVITKISFPVKVKSAVFPSMESPRVENAETTSNKTVRKLHERSVINKQNTAKIIQLILRARTAKAFSTWCLGIVLPYISTASFPVMADFSVDINMENVVVFIPLPVDPGAEPIKHATKTIKIDASCRFTIGIVTNPALLAPIELNIEFTMARLGDMLANVLLRSNNQKRTVKKSVKAMAVLKTILLCREKLIFRFQFGDLRCEKISCQVTNPIPPQNIRMPIVDRTL